MLPYFSSSIVPPTHASPPDDPARKSGAFGSGRPVTTSPVLRDKRIVIVEDEGLTLLQLRKICSLAGMKVVGIASDGQEGVVKVLRSRPHIVLMDIQMPVLDGLSAAELILNDLKICVVMLTAYGFDDYKERAANIGACGYIHKPVTSATLIPQLEAAYSAFRRKPAG